MSKRKGGESKADLPEPRFTSTADTDLDLALLQIGRKDGTEALQREFDDILRLVELPALLVTLLEEADRLLLLRPGGGGVEADKVARGVELEDLGTEA